MKRAQLSLLFDFSVYAIGVIIGFLLILVGAWADMESSAYGFPRLASAGLNGMRCPILMTSGETGKVSLNVSNPTGAPISPSIKTQISTALLPEEFLEHIQLTPGESKRLEWRVDTENIDMGRFIFAKVLLFSAHPLPSQEATCGIFVIDLPGTGRMLYSVLTILSLTGMGWGLYRIKTSRGGSNDISKKYVGSMTFLAIVIVLGLLLGFIGSWILSLLVLVVALLLIVILFSSVLIARSR